MRSSSKPGLLLAAFMGVGALLSGCVGTPPSQSALRLSDDFGQAVNQDLAAQIADPDAAAKEGPPPPSSGARAALAQTRYRHDAVIRPIASESLTQRSPTVRAGAAGMGVAARPVQPAAGMAMVGPNRICRSAMTVSAPAPCNRDRGRLSVMRHDAC